jgi:hypothetical protein
LKVEENTFQEIDEEAKEKEIASFKRTDGESTKGEI